MKVKCYLPESGQIVLRFTAYNYKDLIKGVYGFRSDYLDIYRAPAIHDFFKIVWNDLQKYEIFEDRGQMTDFIFINCS